MIGSRTYITLGVLIVHQILNIIGVEVARPDIESAVDVVLLIIAGIFRFLAKPK